MAQFGQLVSHLLGLDLGAGEHDGLVDGGVGQQVLQQGGAVHGVVGPVQALLDLGLLLGRAGHFDALRLVQQFAGQGAHATVEGGAEHHRLARRGQHGGDGLDVFDEAQVQHAVGFVQHQGLDLGQHGRHLDGDVLQATRGGDDDVSTATQALQLGLVGHAADDGAHGEARDATAQLNGHLGHLLGQLAGRGQHQADGVDRGAGETRRPAGAAVAALVARAGVEAAAGHGRGQLVGVGFATGQDLRQHGQQEGGGLAAAGAAGDHQVGAGQAERHGARLHLGGLGVTGLTDGGQQDFGQAQGIEGHGKLSDSRTRAHRPPGSGRAKDTATRRPRWGRKQLRGPLLGPNGATASPPTENPLGSGRAPKGALQEESEEMNEPRRPQLACRARGEDCNTGVFPKSSAACALGRRCVRNATARPVPWCPQAPPRKAARN